MSYDVAFATTLGDAWRSVRSVCIGPPTSDAPIYVLIERDDEPFLAVAVNESAGAFRDVVVWEQNVVIGYGDAVHVVSLASPRVLTHRLAWYFGHLYVFDSVLLVADARCVLRLQTDGEIAWQSVDVGIDGVTIDEIRDGVILGDGEWDPPGGWRSFRLSVETGETLDD